MSPCTTAAGRNGASGSTCCSGGSGASGRRALFFLLLVSAPPVSASPRISAEPRDRAVDIFGRLARCRADLRHMLHGAVAGLPVVGEDLGALVVDRQHECPGR